MEKIYVATFALYLTYLTVISEGMSPPACQFCQTFDLLLSQCSVLVRTLS